MAFQDLLNALKPKEQDELMSSMDQAQQDRLMNPPAQPEAQAPMIPNETPQEQVFTTPKLSDIVPEKPQDDTQQQVPISAEASQGTIPEKPMSKSEALIAEYNRLMNEREGDLAKARKSDRMLKIGGALGDALATIINAQSQMNVKAPGVQVQQGAGLGKIADMFATAPEISSDIAARREALMKQYAELAKGERSQERLKSQKEIADERNKTTKEAAQLKASAMEGSKSFRQERAEIQDERYVKDKMLGLKKDFRKDYRYKDSYKEDLAFDQVNKLIDESKKGNQIAFNAVGTKMARAMSEVGVLTESDVNRYVEGGSLTRKAGDSLLRMINGKPSEATMDDIKQITEILRETHRSKLAPIFEDYVNDAVQQLGKTREQAYKEFGFPIPPDLKPQPQETKKEQGSFPKTIYKINPKNPSKRITATVKNEKELEEAMAEGFQE